MDKVMKSISVIVLVLFLICLSGCNKGGNLLSAIHDERSCIDIVKSTISFEQLKAVTASTPTIEEFNKAIPLECLREYDIMYRAPIKTEKGWVLVVFDKDRKFVNMKEIHWSKKLDKSDFMEQLKVGLNLAEVQKLDPDGDYTFLYVSWTDYPQKSYHYSADGFEIIISYGNDNCITDISSFLV